jgi:steroid delta-isomerase-like uncharacterized protein
VAETTTPAATSAEQHVRSYFEALGRRDVAAVGEHWAEEGVLELVPLGVRRGRHEVKDFFSELFAAVPDAEVLSTGVVAQEGRVAAEWHIRGTFDGETFQGIDPTGRQIELRGLDLIEVEDGLIKGNTAYYDGMDFARQVGMMPPQDSGAERAMKSVFNAVTKARQVIAEQRGS